MPQNLKIHALLTGCLLLACLVADSSATVLLFGVLLALPVFLRLLLGAATARIRLDGSVPTGFTMGDSVYLQVRVQYKNVFPVGRLLLDLELHNELFGSVETQQIQLRQNSRGRADYRVLLGDMPCGKYRLIFKNVTCTDLLGLTSCSLTAPEQKMFTVLPFIPQMEVNPGLVEHRESAGEENDPRRRGEDVNEVFDTRLYREGDSMHSVHWKLSSKLDQLVVREFGHPFAQDTLLLYDAAGVAFADKNNVLQSDALGLTFALSRGLMNASFPHRVCGFQGDVPCLQTVADKDGYAAMVNDLLSMHVRTGGCSTLEALHATNLLAQCSRILLVTVAFDEGSIRALAAETHLTVMLVTEDAADTFREETGYRVMALSSQALRKQAHYITM